MSDEDNVPKKRGRGRPKKTEVEAKKKRGVVGRPPGEAARIKEFHARLLATSGETVINTIISKILTTSTSPKKLGIHIVTRLCNQFSIGSIRPLKSPNIGLNIAHVK